MQNLAGFSRLRPHALDSKLAPEGVITRRAGFLSFFCAFATFVVDAFPAASRVRARVRVTPGPMASPEKPSIGRTLSSMATFASSRVREGENRVVHVTTGDANIGYHHKGNAISTGKYNPATFFPKGLYEQFRRVANLYFLSVAIISLFDAISPIKPYTIWSPLCLVVGLSMAKEAVEDYQRHKQDHEQNTSLTERFDGVSMTQCEWRDIKAGDIVRVVRDQSFPCDLVLLASPLDDAVCYVETKNLDGETNLKLKRGVEGCGACGARGEKGLKALKALAGVIDDGRTNGDVPNAPTAATSSTRSSSLLARTSSLMRSTSRRQEPAVDPPGARVECEHPNNSLYTFTGNLDVPRAAYDGPLTEDDLADPTRKKKVSLVPYNVLLRGSSLRNTEYVFGVAIYAGHDTKVMMNSSAAPSKRSQIELGMDRVVLLMLLLLLGMGTVTAIVCGVWIKDKSKRAWYLRTSEADMVFNPSDAPLVGVVAFLTSYVLYGYLIPISLYVSLEFVKVMQAAVFINRDRRLYHAETDTPMRARTSNLNEELGMVHVVLSDKTGTLTCNSMEFFKMSIAGGSYGTGVTEIERAVAKRNGNPLPPPPTLDARGNKIKSGPIEPGFNFRDDRVEDGAWMRLPDKETFRDFFRVLAVCHTVIPEGEPTPDTVCYQAESPDESAFVVAAKRFGFFFRARHTSAIEVDEPSHDGTSTSTKRFEILNILEFNSTRKRMSVIARTPEGSIVLYCKGADSVIYERLGFVAGGQAHAAATQAHMDDYAASGLRTLCLAKRELSNAEYASWNETYTAAAQSLEKRDEKIDACAEVIETELELLGATAIEDKLQDGVPGCIEQLMRAGVAVWVLTGDKQDTAINIGQACSLLREDMDVHVININDLIKLESDRAISKEDFDKRGRASVAAQIKKGIAACDECSARERDMGVVIDGRSLAFALEPTLAPDFLSLGTGCVSVVCCRVSPLQKALVTGLVKDSGKITLAIGDGANDVGMIQAAHIGVGISGQEGMQAVMASDFAFAQFRFLERLLLVHGRYNYKRVSRMVTYFFYKNIAFGLTLFAYNLETRASGQVVYNDWLMSAFNIFFVSLPVLALGCFDQDVNQKSCVQFPHLYKQGQENQCFTTKTQLFWALNATYVSVVTYFFVFYGVHAGEADTKDGHAFGLWEVGTTMYTGIVLTINLQMAQMINYWTWVQHCAIWGSILIWYACNAILSDTDRYWSTYSFQIFTPTVAPTPKYWTATPLIVFVALLPDLIVRASRRLFRPEAHHLVQEYERLDKRLRASGAREDVKGAGAFSALAAAEAGAAAGPRTPASASGGATEAGTPIKPSQVGAEVHATPPASRQKSAAGDEDGDGGGVRRASEDEGETDSRRSSAFSSRRSSLDRKGPGHRRRASAERIDVEQLSGNLRNYEGMLRAMEKQGLDVGAQARRGTEHSAVGASAAAASRASTATHSRDSSVISEAEAVSEEPYPAAPTDVDEKKKD